MAKQLSRKEKRAAGIATVAIALPLAFAALRAHLDADPVLIIPPQQLPSPNAYDYFVKAGQMIKATEVVTPGSGAVDEITDTRMSVGLSAAQLAARYPTAGKVAWIQKIGPALALLRQGFKCRYAEPRHEPGTSFAQLARARESARQLAIESHSRSERGDWGGAANSSLDGMRMGSAIQSDGPLISSLVGIACDAISRRDLNQALPHLSANQARAVAATMEQLYARRSTVAAMYQREKWAAASGLCAAMRKPDWRAEWYHDGIAIYGTTDRWYRLRLALSSKQSLFDSYMRLHEAAARRARLSYRQQHSLPDLVPDNTVLAQSGWGLSVNTSWLFARGEADDLLLMTQFALRAYKLDNRYWPTTLQQLTPRYIKKVPLDPFGGGETLHYKLGAMGPLLYSVGPDSIDNGGQPIDDPTLGTLPRQRHMTGFNRKGDVVAGINDQ